MIKRIAAGTVSFLLAAGITAYLLHPTTGEDITILCPHGQAHLPENTAVGQLHGRLTLFLSSPEGKKVIVLLPDNCGVQIVK